MELSLIGLQNAGKTSLVNVLTTGAFHEDMIPTVGFNMRKVTKGAVTIKLWDLGGQVRRKTFCFGHVNMARLHSDLLWMLQPRFRSMWERYCRGVQAIVYVVDSADHDSLDSGRQELHELLQKPSLASTPLLVLGNKNDLPGALSTTEIIERLDLRVCVIKLCSLAYALLCVEAAACVHSMSLQHLCQEKVVDMATTQYLLWSLQALQDREVCVYSISCKNQTNIDKTIEWLMKHAKS